MTGLQAPLLVSGWGWGRGAPRGHWALSIPEGQGGQGRAPFLPLDSSSQLRGFDLLFTPQVEWSLMNHSWRCPDEIIILSVECQGNSV